jgi:hypothetical protein
MNPLQSKLARIGAVLKQNKFVVLAAGLVLLFLVIIFLSINSTPQNNVISRPDEPRVEPTSKTVNPVTAKPANLYNPGITWTATRFSESDLKDIQYTESSLPDGSTKYSYESTNPNRPNEIIVNDGIVIYQRSLINNKYIYNYTNTLGAPDYVFQSSKFYGTNTMTYVYLRQGTAFVADTKTTLVKEQLSFQPASYSDFKQKYAEDIADFTVIPTLADEENAIPPSQE